MVRQVESKDIIEKLDKNFNINKSDDCNGKNKEVTNNSMNKTVWIIFGSLLLDLLAFTMILPLLPALLDHYRLNDGENGYYKWLESSITYFQNLLGTPQQFNSVLFGGFLGSMYSFLQFLASPVVGGVSDVYGRKPVLLLCLVSQNKLLK